MEELLTLDEVAQKLKVTRATVHKWMNEGMPSLKIGKNRRFEAHKIMDWIIQKSESAGNKSAHVGGDTERSCR